MLVLMAVGTTVATTPILQSIARNEPRVAPIDDASYSGAADRPLIAKS